MMELIRNAAIAKAAGDTFAHFRNLELVYINTHPFYSDEEKAELKDNIRKIEALLENHKNSAGIWVGENMCDRLHERLIALLFKYKIIYQTNAQKTWEDLVDEDFQ